MNFISQDSKTTFATTYKFSNSISAKKGRKKERGEKRKRKFTRREWAEIRRARRGCRFDYKGGRGETQFINFPGVHVGYFGAVSGISIHRYKLYLQRERAHNCKLVGARAFRKSHGG